MKLSNRQVIYSLKNESAQRHTGEYFQILQVDSKYHLYYCSENRLKVAISDSLSFLNSQPSVILEHCPGGCFCIIQEDNGLFMLCGAHKSNKEDNEIEIPDLVWPPSKLVTDHTTKRNDRKNGMYLLMSQDGICWKPCHETPVLHASVSSESCSLGEVGFDTSPCLIKKDDQFYYYGRLNSSLDERRIYLRKSKDLMNWSAPERISVTNENQNNLKKNYYNPVVFSYNSYILMLTPYFESCGTENRHSTEGKTLLLRSDDALCWEIIDSCLPHQGKYKHRVNDTHIQDDSLLVFYRENIPESRQNLVSFNLELETL